MSRLYVITASTRPGRTGGPLGQWVADRAREHGGFEVVPVDLARVNLPFLDEPEHPSTGRYVHQHTRDWSATIAAADAFVLVMPMYNGGFSAPLKNALDYLHAEWRDKPVGFVSYSGGASGGVGAVEMIRPVVGRLGMVPAGATVAVPHIDQHIGADGRFEPGDGMGEAVVGLLDELERLAPRSAAA